MKEEAGLGLHLEGTAVVMDCLALIRRVGGRRSVERERGVLKEREG